MLRIAQEVFGTVLLFIQPRMIAVAILGVTAGLPLALTGSVLTAWMTEAGVSLGSIGLIALVGLSYNFKFLWAPVIDQLPLPPLTTWLGRPLAGRQHPADGCAVRSAAEAEAGG